MRNKILLKYNWFFSCLVINFQQNYYNMYYNICTTCILRSPNVVANYLFLLLFYMEIYYHVPRPSNPWGTFEINTLFSIKKHYQNLFMIGKNTTQYISMKKSCTFSKLNEKNEKETSQIRIINL